MYTVYEKLKKILCLCAGTYFEYTDECVDNIQIGFGYTVIDMSSSLGKNLI